MTRHGHSAAALSRRRGSERRGVRGDLRGCQDHRAVSRLAGLRGAEGRVPLEPLRHLGRHRPDGAGRRRADGADRRLQRRRALLRDAAGDQPGRRRAGLDDAADEGRRAGRRLPRRHRRRRRRATSTGSTTACSTPSLPTPAAGRCRASTTCAAASWSTSRASPASRAIYRDFAADALAECRVDETENAGACAAYAYADGAPGRGRGRHPHRRGARRAAELVPDRLHWSNRSTTSAPKARSALSPASRTRCAG